MACTVIQREPLQSLIDPFIRGVGGELVTDLVDNRNPPKNADYLFRHRGVIAELKALQNNSFGESFVRKMGDLVADWQRRRLIIVYGRARVELRRLPPICQNEFLTVLGKPLQDNILSKANEQIRETKELFVMPEAKGLLMVASDGNEDLQPNDVWFLLTRMLQKKHADGRPQFSNIHALAYFNPRMPVKLPGSGQPTFLCLSGTRQNDDREMGDFLSELFEAWFMYVERSLGQPIQRVSWGSKSLEDLKFTGVLHRMPLITSTPSSRTRK